MTNIEKNQPEKQVPAFAELLRGSTKEIKLKLLAVIMRNPCKHQYEIEDWGPNESGNLEITFIDTYYHECLKEGLINEIQHAAFYVTREVDEYRLELFAKNSYWPDDEDFFRNKYGYEVDGDGYLTKTMSSYDLAVSENDSEIGKLLLAYLNRNGGI